MDELVGKTIFHIGNIANNAYNSAAFERKMGLNSFAISPEYLHVMAFPFWETDTLMVHPNQTFDPYSHMNANNMPEWFLYGSWQEIYEDLKKQLQQISNDKLFEEVKLSSIQEKKLQIISILLKYGRTPLKRILPNGIRHWLSNSLLVQLRRESHLNYSRVFDLADIVVFYGAHNAYATISKWNGRYISLEHGTLRDYINSDFYLAKKSKEAYKKSFRTLITNQDCLEAAYKLGITQNSLLKSPHPSSDFDFEELRRVRLQTIGTLPKEIFCPSRHSYGSIVDRGKGNRFAIEGILKALQTFPDLRATFVEWGDDVEKSRKLIRELDLESKIEWIGVLSRRALKERMAKSLVVLDQFTIPAYGGITADAIGLGVPVITHQDPDLDVAFFGSIAPVLPAKNSNEIFLWISSLLTNKDLNREVFENSINWYDSNLSSKIAFERRKSAYLDKIGLTENLGI